MRSRFSQALRSPIGLVAAIGATSLLVLAIAAPLIWGSAAATIDVSSIDSGISRAHPFGTDGLGRDVLLRVLVATRLSVGLAALAVAIGATVGVALGSIPVVLGPRGHRFVVWLIELGVAFPSLLVAIFADVVVGVGARGAVVGLAAGITPAFARLTTNLVASVSQLDFVSAARLVGVPRRRIVTHHILPNVAEPIVLNVTLSLGSALLGLAGLSFLGLGVQPPGYDWGRLLNEGLARVFVSPAAAIGPGLAIVLAGLVFGLLGDVFSHVASGRARHRRAQPRSSQVAVTSRAKARVVAAADEILDLRSLSVVDPIGGRVLVKDVSVRLLAGETVGIVGESGSGKTLTALAIAQLLPYPLAASWDSQALCGRDVGALSVRQRREFLGSSVAMVFQDPMTSLNPMLRVGRQMAEVATVHGGATSAEASRAALLHMDKVHLRDGARLFTRYPHQLSGGMRQRVMIAMGLMASPRLLIADEPTTALDVTVQRGILDLLHQVREETGVATLLISHDIAVLAQVCDRILVMYAGNIVEELSTTALEAGGRHPYTRALIDSFPAMDAAKSEPLARIPGNPSGPTAKGCAFAARCTRAQVHCHESSPPLVDLAPHHKAACWNPHLPSRTENPTFKEALQ